MTEKHKLQILIENAGLEPRSYSGRGMFGQSCLGVNCANPLDMFSYIIEFEFLDTPREHDELIDLLDILKNAMQKAKIDSMGLRQIVYWPTIPYVE